MDRKPATPLDALKEGPARLPAGEVEASQRRRMLAALISVVAEKGYARVVVADVVKLARVSRASFYEQFTGKDECFLAAFDTCADELVKAVGSAVAGARTPRERLTRLVRSYFGGLANFPEGGRVCLVEIYAAGPGAIERRQAVREGFVESLRGVHADLAAAGEPVRELDDFAFEALAAAVGSLATDRLARGAADQLTELAAPVEGFVLNVFGLGPPA